VFIQPASNTASNLLLAGLEVITRMLANGGELVTVLLGASALPGIDTELELQLHATHPEVEFVSYFSGQADAVLLIGVENE
jgi:dihydroxyacetone kinase-like predicted kinase